MRRRALMLLIWLWAVPLPARPTAPAALLADLQAWQAIPDPVARQNFGRQRVLPWFDLDAMLWRLLGPRLAALPPARRQALRRALGAFLLDGLTRQRPATGWTGRLMATAGAEGLLQVTGRRADGRPLSAAFALRRTPFGWRVVDVQLDGTDWLEAWCRRKGCP